MVAKTYAANFGDVVKHAVLCEVIVRERPRRYLESHGGRLSYELADLVPGPGGVWDFSRWRRIMTSLTAPPMPNPSGVR